MDARSTEEALVAAVMIVTVFLRHPCVDDTPLEGGKTGIPGVA